MLRPMTLAVFVCAVVSVSLSVNAQAPAEPRKVAFLVGVNKYERRNFDDLVYAERDVEDVGAELKRLGFTVVVLKGSAEGDLKATREHIDKELLRLLDGVRKDDLVFVMFSGHGQQLAVKRSDGSEKEDAFFCPVDAIKDDPEHLFSVSYVIDDVLAKRGGRNLVLIDACRDEPKDPSRGGKGVQGRTIALPEETAVFFSCRAGQRSFENDQAGGGHGLFTYCLLDGLRGKAVQGETLTWTSLVGYVENMMDSDEIRKLLPPNRKQEPLPAGNVGRLVLARITVVAPDAELDPKIAEATEAIRKNPNDAAAYRNRGIAWYNKKEYDKAIADYTEAIRIDPKLEPPYFNRGLARYHKRDYDKAIADYNEAIRIDPKAPAYFGRGAAWIRKKEYDKAIADYDETIRLDPKLGTAYLRRGIAWGHKGEYEKAIADCTEAIHIDPKFADAYFNRGIAWTNKNEYEKAIADYTEANRLNPNDAGPYYGRAWIRAFCPDAHFRDGKLAVSDATRACELTNWKDPNKIEVLADAYEEAGDSSLAAQWRKKATELKVQSEKP
jgi:tetratricopeptide (TPR) repeat protein